jgi:hypothetical protein
VTRPWRPAVGECRPQVVPPRWERSKNEVHRCQIVIDLRQDYLEVSVCVAIHVGLDNGISLALESSDAVSDGTCTLAAERKRLVSATARVGVDRRKVDHIPSLNEVNDGVGRGHRAVGYSRENEPIRTRPAGQRVRIDPADQRVPSSATGKSIRACEPGEDIPTIVAADQVAERVAVKNGVTC